MPGPLDDDELRRWSAWKRAADAVWAGVVADIARATGLSAPDFSVLTRVAEEGGGRLRQQRLADGLGWERGRLSRHLDRMAQRGLLTRPGTRTERLVALTSEGAAAVADARIAHATAVRRHLLEVADDPDDGFWRVVGRLAPGS